jgi:hypothetical protein
VQRCDPCAPGHVHFPAWLAVVNVLGMLGIVIAVMASNAMLRQQADEGTALHIWQLLMVGRVPVAGFAPTSKTFVHSPAHHFVMGTVGTSQQKDALILSPPSKRRRLENRITQPLEFPSSTIGL